MQSLKALTRWAVKQSWDVPPVKANVFNGILMEQLFIKPPFQIERVTLGANYLIPSHCHPNVDSWEFALAGRGLAQIGHREFIIDAGRQNRPVFIPRGLWHGGQLYEAGGVWLSIQQWSVNIKSLMENWITRDTARAPFSSKLDASQYAAL